MNYIIVQAGGKGTRLGYLTKNKPKALTPIENLPMLFHLFRKFSDKRFIIIADYKKEVIRKYLEAFSKVIYQVVDASGTGTCAGIQQALELIPNHEKFMLIWSDLILPEEFELPAEYADKNENAKGNYVGLSTTFPCRWKYKNGMFAEERSCSHGVAGFFLFKNKADLAGVPESGELVRWFQEQNMTFDTVSLAGTREFGILEEYEKLAQVKTRPFNRITINGDILIKEPIDEQGRSLAKRECAWYEAIKGAHISGIPKVYETDPLKMEFIKGKNIYECDYVYDDKKRVLKKLINTLKELHGTKSIPADSFSVKEAYYHKTMRRLSKVEYLVPYAREKYIRINGRNCRNVFFYKDRLEKRLMELKTERFPLIHGDCTFSNMMVRDNGDPVLIDPRGYFGFTELFGDERYDWAKLYYSLVGNYDRFNLKEFSLDIGGHTILDGELMKDLDEGEIRLSIQSNGWEELERDFFELTEANREEIRLLHAVIWLSLTTYAWQDYDSICGAFYNGLYYLEDVL